MVWLSVARRGQVRIKLTKKLVAQGFSPMITFGEAASFDIKPKCDTVSVIQKWRAGIQPSVEFGRSGSKCFALHLIKEV